MRIIHPHSSECCKSELDLFSVPPTQTSIENSQWSSINPINAVATPESPLEFIIPSSGDLYLDPSNIFLYVKATVKKAGGEEVNADEKMHPENNILHTMFSSCEVYMNEISVTSSSNYYQYRAYIETLLNYGEDAKHGHLSSAGFFPEAYKSLHIRYFNAAERKVFDCYGRLHGDIFQQGKLIINGVDMRIKLSRAPPAFCIKTIGESSAGAAAFYPDILEAYLYVRRVRLTPSKHLDIEKRLMSTPAKYPIRRVGIKMFTIASGLISSHLDNIVMGNLPHRLILGLVDHGASNGEYKKSGFKFNHFDLRSLDVHVNGSPVGRPLEASFSSDIKRLSLSAKAFHDLFMGLDFDLQRGNGITKTTFQDEFCLYAFDLTPDHCADAPEHVNVVKQGTLSVALSFAKATSVTLSCVCLMEYNNIIEIDKARNVLYDY